MAEEELDCSGDAVDLSYRGLRIASIFIIMVASLIGAVLPIFLARQSKVKVPKLTFFICKYVGTGVIIATAWLHLLAPAAENLGDECLKPRLGEYPWPFAIALWTVLIMFVVEMMAMRAAEKGKGYMGGSSDIDLQLDPAMDIVALKQPKVEDINANSTADSGSPIVDEGNSVSIPGRSDEADYVSGADDHMAHARSHEEGDKYKSNLGGQLIAIFILEFGVVFHSVFIGLTLGTTDEVIILLVVLVFHQMFEGLGLGSRLAIAPWPQNKRWLPYLLGMIFALSTPVGIAVGVAAQPKNANTQKLVNGIFDAISAGILMYTGLVELLAHEFMFNPYMRRAPLWMLVLAFGCVAFGMAVMATLAVWA
jgi:solute carrier family 39 (zinc transporter), member 1/2/3